MPPIAHSTCRHGTSEGSLAIVLTMHQASAQSRVRISLLHRCPVHVVCAPNGAWCCLERRGQFVPVPAAAALAVLQQYTTTGTTSLMQHYNPYVLVPAVLAAEGQGKSRKLSVTLCKQPAASGQRFAIWSSLLQQVDAQKSPDKRDQLLTKRVE